MPCRCETKAKATALYLSFDIPLSLSFEWLPDFFQMTK